MLTKRYEQTRCATDDDDACHAHPHELHIIYIFIYVYCTYTYDESGWTEDGLRMNRGLINSL